MTRVIILVVALLFTWSENINAQELSYGFRVGLNVSSLNGDTEPGESYSTNTGFHVGGGVRFEITDLFGIRSEIVFTQKGTKRTFSGDGPFVFRGPNGKILTNGNKSVSLNISNAYLEIPIMAYGKIGKKLEVFGGGYTSFLVGSTASGELVYTDGRVEGNNNIIDPLNLTLDYNYGKQEAGELIDGAENITLEVGGEIVDIPNTLGAYYDLDEKSGKPYKVFDAGLSAGAAFFLNGGLYFSAIANYGLVDVTNSDLDFSYTEIEGFDFKTRDDKDNNLSFQFSLGFSF
ncbi:MAG: outer membrane beta-barrel protein [Saprospiraceae bacterium]